MKITLPIKVYTRVMPYIPAVRATESPTLPLNGIYARKMERTLGEITTMRPTGLGCYDWYSEGIDTSKDPYHGNVAKFTKNAIDYLTGK